MNSVRNIIQCTGYTNTLVSMATGSCDPEIQNLNETHKFHSFNVKGKCNGNVVRWLDLTLTRRVYVYTEIYIYGTVS